MKFTIAVLLLGTALAAPGFAQTSNDDTVATEAWWDKVGAGFFSDASLETPRPEFEIRAHFTGLIPSGAKADSRGIPKAPKV
ncbi:hypothetical protein RNZ50_05005 [Paracoccaceae bacterium Fryx2]|nr:hypothetical protein [Paracoccaceae bacterium Fryx2]